jgi:copper(I)-binding protein
MAQRTVQLACWTVLLLLLAACAPTTLAVSDIYSMPGSIGQICAAYFTIDNPTDQADVLIGAQSDIAESTEMHAMSIDAGGHMVMERQTSINVPAHAKVEFKPGGLHLMFTNLKRDVKTGDSFPLTLQFQNRGAITIQVTVDL